jgi:hypothetical protein
VSRILINGTGEGNKGTLTSAEIGGVIGGVLGFVVVVGVITWLIMRRLNEVMRFIKTRLEPGQASNGSYVPQEPQAEIPNAYTSEPPSEVWDPHSQGYYHNTTRELTGSYEAHGVSEMAGSERTEKK